MNIMSTKCKATFVSSVLNTLQWELRVYFLIHFIYENRFIHSFYQIDSRSFQGTGIWYIFPLEPMGPSKDLNLMEEGEASRTRLLDSDNNVAHFKRCGNV